MNDWTPLHYSVAIRSVEAIRLLLSVGADPALATRIDDYRTAIEETEAGMEGEQPPALGERAQRGRHP